MDEEVERPVCRTLFRQASHETRLDPTVPSDSDDSENEDDLYSKPRVVDVLVKEGSVVKTPDQSTIAESKVVRKEHATSPTENKNESNDSESVTEKSDKTSDLRANQRCIQEKDKPTTNHEYEVIKEANVSVIGQDKERPTTHNAETEIYKQEDTMHDHQMESIGTLKGKIHKQGLKRVLEFAK